MIPPAVAAEGLSVQLGDHRALIDLNFALPEGAFMAILGPNGAGKSTLLKLILGVVEPTSGTIRVFGREPMNISASEVGYVPQFKTLDRSFPALPIELVLTGLSARWPWIISPSNRDRAMSALNRVGAEHLAERPIGHLSGGELQRVYLARSIVREPRLVLLDEPASGMDVTGESDMYRILEKYQAASGATVLMITHDWGAALHHSSHVLMVNRKMISFGSPHDALSDHSLREAFSHLGHAHAMAIEGHDHA